MRTFHTGGVAGGADITMGLPRVEEIFEARPPQFKALIAEADGSVLAVEERGKNKAIIVADSETAEKREYLVSPNTAVAVVSGDVVKRGDRLCEGHVDLKELFATTGDLNAVARYIIREVQSIYFPTGDTINDKHVELIVRAMFSRMKVADTGETELLAGDTVEKRKFIRANLDAKARGKAEATGEQRHGRHQSRAHHGILLVLGFVPGDRQGAHRVLSGRQGRPATRPQGERHHRQAHSCRYWSQEADRGLNLACRSKNGSFVSRSCLCITMSLWYNTFGGHLDAQ
jgi:hypothetical protein